MPLRTELIIYRESIRLTVRALASIAILVGVAIIVGGPVRFNHAPSLQTAAAVPGGWITWGLLDITIGGWTLVVSRRWWRRGVMIGLIAQTILFSFWTVSIGMAAFDQPTAPLTGIAVYCGYSVACAISYVAGHELRRIEGA